MNDFGGKLRQAREARGISLRQIAASTKITVSALEGLERNDISKLPGGIFSRAFVRSYAAEVGLDPDETVREFLERFQGEPVSAPVPVVHLPPEEIAFERRQRRAAWLFVALVVAMLAAATVVGYYVLRMRPAPDPAASLAAFEPAGTQSGPQAGVSVLSAADPAAPTAPPPAPDAIRIELRPSGRCWVSAVIDGATSLQRVLDAGERETLTARETAVLTVGDAGACVFAINGRAARPLGRSGDVRTARISRETIDQFVR